MSSTDMVSEDPGLGWPGQLHCPAPEGNHSPRVLCKGHFLEHNTESDEVGSPRVVQGGVLAPALTLTSCF